MKSETAEPIDFEFLASLFLEMAQERSLAMLLQKLAQRALTGPSATIVIVWLTEKSDKQSLGMPDGGTADQSMLYAVAGGASKLADIPDRPSRLPDHLARIPVGSGLIGQIALTGQVCLLTDLDHDPGDLADAVDWLRTERIRGFVGAPIIYRGEVLGVVGSFSRVIPPQAMRHWGRVFADHLAAAIANARAFEEIQRLKTQLEQQNASLLEEVVEAKAFGVLVGQSAALGQVVSQIDLVAPTDASVLILGETGTGKELVAHEIHRRSQRRDKPLIRVNCASVPKDLYESEFFGHAKGAFTGAIKDRAGRFETAEGGTLFLDEIAEVPLDLQSKLLRVLQEKRYERVGEDRTRRADVRIMAATNRDLKREVEAGRFRQDLYYRLGVFPIEVPPLRERIADIAPLAEHFLRASSHGSDRKLRLDRQALRQLEAYSWPGNVRELQNALERARIVAANGNLRFDGLGGAPSSTAEKRRHRVEVAATSPGSVKTREQLRDEERANLENALAACGGKVFGPEGAAKLLGMKPTTLASRLKALGVVRRRGG